ncbi:MAG TPA: hypothetical protein VJ890_13675, partial [Vineibacter sp.]|nr:hypothetical protein [Vineibacter sp.]
PPVMVGVLKGCASAGTDASCGARGWFEIIAPDSPPPSIYWRMPRLDGIKGPVPRPTERRF